MAAGAQDRRALAGELAAADLGPRRERGDVGVEGVQPGFLLRRGHVHHAPRRQQRPLDAGQPARLQEVEARGRQCADRRVAVGPVVHRRGAPGRVIPGLRFPLQQDDATVGRQLPAHGGAGDAAADDDEVGVGHARARGSRLTARPARSRARDRARPRCPPRSPAARRPDRCSGRRRPRYRRGAGAPWSGSGSTAGPAAPRGTPCR